MMTRLVRVVVVVTMALAVMSGTALAQADKKAAAPSVSGKWALTVEAGPHGVTTMGLALKQDGKKVTGTFASPHGDVPVEGTFVDGSLTLATIATGADSPEVSFNAKLKDTGTLAGYLSSPMGDMKWTADRVKDTK